SKRDWSSDVCSSDLVKRPARHCGGDNGSVKRPVRHCGGDNGSVKLPVRHCGGDIGSAECPPRHCDFDNGWTRATPPPNKKTASHHTAACCFLNSLCLISIDKRQIPIMTKASRKNMPPISPGVVVSENIYLSAILASSSPIKIIGKAFVCLTYNSEFLTSYFVVIISTIENTAPISTVSAMCVKDNLKYGNIYISAPVDIITGGMIIFFNVSGVLLAC